MKNSMFKKVFALICSMVMMFSLLSVHTGAASIFDGTTKGSISITKMDTGNINPVGGVKFDYLKVADARQYQYKEGNVTRTELVFALTTEGEGVFDAITEDYTDSDGIKLYKASTIQAALIAIGRADDGSINKTITYTGSATTDATGIAKFENLDLGVYLVNEDLANSNPTIDGETVTVAKATGPFLVSVPSTVDGTNWNYDVSVTPKNIIEADVPGEKTANGTNVITVTDAEGNVVSYNARIGDEYTYTIKTTIVPTTDATKYTKLVVEDNASSGITYSDFARDTLIKSAKLGALDLTYDVDYLVVVFPASNNFTIELTAAGLEKLNAVSTNTDLVFTYNAKLNETALTDGSNTNNTASITHSHNGTNGGGAVPPVTVYTYDIDIAKIFDTVAGITPDPTAVKFKLVDPDGTDVYAVLKDGKYVVTPNASDTGAVNEFTCGIDGKLVIHGLSNGEYTLTETATDANYSLLKDAVKVKVENSNVSLSIKNEKRPVFELPLTGGAGTWIYTAGGMALIGAALFMLLKSGKKKVA